jgi:hypothetical protein
MKLDLDRLEWWVAKGARPTDSVLRLVNIAKLGTESESTELTVEAIETAAADEGAEIGEQKEEDS